MFQNLYQKYIGSPVTLDSHSSIQFNLSQEKWMSFLKILSKLKIPQLNEILLDSVPGDWEEVRSFLSNSISSLKRLYFNTDWNMTVNASKYLESLMVASTKTSDVFDVDFTNFSPDEFRQLVCAAKGTKLLYFVYNGIALDEQVDFGNMEGSKIEYISFNSSGGLINSNWKARPMRFENLVASIAKSQGLKDSLKELNIKGCEITKEKAQEVLNKYNLKSVALTGV